MTNSHAKIYGEIPADQPIRAPIGRRRKSLRQHFCDGIEAAVKAEPEAFQTTKPRTMLGLIVHSLVKGAGTGRCDQVKLVVFFLDEAERRRGLAELEDEPLDNSQGNSGPHLPAQQKWDWGEDGAWDSSVRADDAKAREEAEQKKAHSEVLRAEIGDRFHRALEAERINTERRVRMQLEREGRLAPRHSQGIFRPLRRETRMPARCGLGGGLWKGRWGVIFPAAGKKAGNNQNLVIAGLVPATHEHETPRCSWMAGTRPAKTYKLPLHRHLLRRTRCERPRRGQDRINQAIAQHLRDHGLAGIKSPAGSSRRG